MISLFHSFQFTVALGHVLGGVPELGTVPAKGNRRQSANRQATEISAPLHLRRCATDAITVEMADLQIRARAIQLNLHNISNIYI